MRLTLYGTEGTHVAQLRPAAASNAKHGPAGRRPDNAFKEGAVDEFMVDTVGDLGNLFAIYIWHEGRNDRDVVALAGQAWRQR